MKKKKESIEAISFIGFIRKYIFMHILELIIRFRFLFLYGETYGNYVETSRAALIISLTNI